MTNLPCVLITHRAMRRPIGSCSGWQFYIFIRNNLIFGTPELRCRGAPLLLPGLPAPFGTCPSQRRRPQSQRRSAARTLGHLHEGAQFGMNTQPSQG